jgi:hypothetical protein
VLHKRQEFLPNIFSKSFSHFIKLIPHNEKLNFRSFRKSFITAVAMQFSKAIVVTNHSDPRTILSHYIDKKQIVLDMFNRPLYREDQHEVEVEEIRNNKNPKKENQVER